MNTTRAFWITVGINLFLFILYFCLIYFTNSGSGGPYTPDLFAVFATAMVHTLFCFLVAIVLAFVKEGRAIMKGFLLSALLIFIVGFSSCFG